ncbi:AraC family transcriptional regulator [Bdellovibrio sp. HCB2-146]|uniref:AraC family transcriptional regulator n=1 Tax=Bdellovibrio sp. HCB2-146 TaxID=3394362 RepID=UPI0039BC9B9F
MPKTTNPFPTARRPLKAALEFVEIGNLLGAQMKPTDPILNSQLKALIELAQPAKLTNGTNKTKLPYFVIQKNDQPTPFERGILDPSICLIVQGKKLLNIAKETIYCNPGEFIASAIDMPIAGHVVKATPKEPYIGLRITFEPKEIFSVIKEAEIKINPKGTINPGAFVRPAHKNLGSLFLKLLEQAQSESSSKFIAGLAKKELIYELLASEFNHLLLQNSSLFGKDKGIVRALDWIKENFDKTITVEEIADESGMSASALFSKFKAVTSMSPLQYQKQLRMQEARRLLMFGLMDVTRAAVEVGYASPNQFNREYKRFFGNPPLRDIKQLQGP